MFRSLVDDLFMHALCACRSMDPQLCRSLQPQILSLIHDLHGIVSKLLWLFWMEPLSSLFGYLESCCKSKKCFTNIET